MIKILHCADLHLDSSFSGRTPQQVAVLRRNLLEIPHKIAKIGVKEQCDLLLFAGDVFDGSYSAESLAAFKNALEEVAVPVLVAPGNHDFCDTNSPWITEIWPKNVHIFKKPVIESVSLPELDCRVYGAGFQSMDCPALLNGFRAEGTERYHIGVFHGDPTQRSSFYNPITALQVQDSGLEYLALGHIHKSGSFIAGSTLCAWPGCPMGRGYDEVGQKGVLLVTIEDTATIQPVYLDTPVFYDLETPADSDAAGAVSALLPAVGNQDFYRISLTGPSAPIDLNALQAQFSQFPNLVLRDETVPEIDPWSSIGEDTLEGVYFRKLRSAIENQDEQSRRCILLAAKISRQLLDGQEVTLP